MRSPLHGQSNQVRSQSQHYLKGSATNLGFLYVLESPPCNVDRAHAGPFSDQELVQITAQTRLPAAQTGNANSLAYGMDSAQPAPRSSAAAPPSLCRWSHR